MLDSLEELEKIAAQLEKGEISRSEFDLRKAEILQAPSTFDTSKRDQRVAFSRKKVAMGSAILILAGGLALSMSNMSLPGTLPPAAASIAPSQLQTPVQDPTPEVAVTEAAGATEPGKDVGVAGATSGPSEDAVSGEANPPSDSRSSAERLVDNDPLVVKFEELEEGCRGGTGDEATTSKVCAKRDAMVSVLNERGFCLGKEGEAGYQMQWHHCGPGSLKGLPH